ncbi:hypothetical protein [Sphingobacterium sp. JB170]|uniref:hypothetical protein n=1 Tax=Sphingobacterium sp. JB170 TaxID=1434842 RepID=UPI00097EB3CA|nr:hypothetical protein [Sphingobacterium sp. JB170]SJN49016.1 hypothetical protein FM107_18000 [Sphingobacterium sp. JB170]
MEYTESNKSVKKSSDWKPEEILGFLQEFDACKSEIGLTKFCQDRQLSPTTFRSWIKKRRNGGLPSKGKFIELPLAVQPEVPSVSEGLFASICINGIEVKLHQYVGPDYLHVLLNKTSAQ